MGHGQVKVSHMNTNRFSGKSILITGGAGGLGSQIARSVIAQGGSVGILDTNEVAIQSLVSELKASGGNAAGQKVFQSRCEEAY